MPGAAILRTAARIVVALLGVLTDPLWLPLAERLQRDQRWWVVEVRRHGPDSEYVRIAEAADGTAARARRDELEAAAAGRRGRTPLGTE